MFTFLSKLFKYEEKTKQLVGFDLDPENFMLRNGREILFNAPLCWIFIHFML